LETISDFPSLVQVKDEIKKFEDLLKGERHFYCNVCKGVSMYMQLKDGVCTSCIKGKMTPNVLDSILPIWTSDNGIKHYDLPQELIDLTEGEKLLISPLLLYVPLHHLQRGQLGCKGHVCCFEQDVGSVCTKLPRLPSDIQLIKVIKQFKDCDGIPSQKTFRVRRNKVMDALRFLKKHSHAFADIELVEENLHWMGKHQEEELPSYTHINEVDEMRECDDDLGPSTSQVQDVLNQEEYVEHVLGSVQKATTTTPCSSGAANLNETIDNAVKTGRYVLLRNTKILFFGYHPHI
jgi:hypothetical protein